MDKLLGIVMTKLTLIILSVLLGFTNFLCAQPLKSVIIKKETPQYIIDINYPQGFTDKKIDDAVKQLVQLIRQTEPNPATDDKGASDLPGKNSLTIKYKVVYQTPKVVSLLFTISTYAKGAAHPNNTIRTLNIIEGKSVQLTDLFLPKVNFLNPIVRQCRKKLSTVSSIDKKWMISGTEAKLENYEYWNFNKNGITIIFDTYQVAPYVFGPQTVSIPHSLLLPVLNPSLSKIIWGNA